ncbi:MAG: 50S ribosomal protein L15 [Actinobacteria bacterium]|nr:MAG: 50S ribosomal protein L15 [Actinomycetota bacterium]
MKLHHLRPAPGAHKKARRVGRGHGSGRGKTSGRGTKGSGARTTVPVWFEGGQMPLQRRIPKLGGFSNARFKVTYLPVNVESLNSFGSGATVTPESLRTAGLVRKSRGQVKILGRGDVTVALNVKAHAFSETAKAKITAAGGTVEVL